ncbi:MAG: hypothetical protein ACYTGN_05820 [Planctomycetota bacterium]|jgi:hypothetical protein
MITKEQLLDSMRAECSIIKHLATKVPEGGLEYRPSDGQRSTMELMRYLTRGAIVPAIHAVTDSWDHGEEYEKQTESVTPENFAAEMDRQVEMLEKLFAEIDAEEALTKPTTMPWGTPTTTGAGLMDMALKLLVAYRMQLFLYVKAAGADVSSPDCWVGVSPP